jgi:integrase
VTKGKAAHLDAERGIHEKVVIDSEPGDVRDVVAPPPKCPQCTSQKVVRDGQRALPFGETIQRWYCKQCDRRFSDPEQLHAYRSMIKALEKRLTKPLKAQKWRNNRQICAEAAIGGAKNLDPEQNSIQEVPEKREDIKGKLVQFAWWMRQEGYAAETIRGNGSCLKALISRGAILADPVSVKDALAKDQRWSGNRRRNVINAYTLFLRFNGTTWSKPKCKVTQKFPFIPAEKEIDDLIAGSGKKNAAFCQTLKETAMRSGEAKRLQWTDIDFERNVITLNEPEKGSNPRMWKVNSRLIEMLNMLPKQSEFIFTGSLKSMKTTFLKTRKRLAANLQNPRLLKISFHTFRHWKATTLYHHTKDIYYVQQFLGHKDIRNTMVYINIERTIFGASDDNEFTVRVTEKPEEIKALLEVGFEYVCQKDNLAFLRKRK